VFAIEFGALGVGAELFRGSENALASRQLTPREMELEPILERIRVGRLGRDRDDDLRHFAAL
jgi:hypothetical protein